jgi:hypothetical protein
MFAFRNVGKQFVRGRGRWWVGAFSVAEMWGSWRGSPLSVCVGSDRDGYNGLEAQGYQHCIHIEIIQLSREDRLQEPQGLQVSLAHLLPQ